MSKQQRGTTWSVTINNPIQADEDNIGLARSKGWTVKGQLEQGEQGTKHYQLMVKTPQVRFSALKKAFPRAHIEIARNVVALEHYVTKEETRAGGLPQNKSYLSLAQLWEYFTDWVEEHKLNMAKETWDEDTFLDQFDWFIRDMIISGYHVETMAVNPQVRGCVKKFGREIIIRSQNIRSQTDRQTDESIISDIENAGGNDESTETEGASEKGVHWEDDESYTNSESSENETDTESGGSCAGSTDVSEEY